MMADLFPAWRRRAAPGIAFLLAAVLIVLAPGAGLAESGNFPDEAAALIAQADRHFERIHEDWSRMEKAVRLHQLVLERNPGHVEARWKLAELLYLSGMEEKQEKARKALYGQCLEHAQKALSLDPSCVPALFYCGCAHSSLADLAGPISAMSLLKQGKEELARTMKTAPGNRFGVLAASVLSQVNTETPWPIRDLGEAESLARKAAAWDPNLTMASAQLAAVHYHRKDYAQALQEAQRCLDTTEPTYMSDAVLWDWPAARAILQKAQVELNHNPPMPE